MIGKTRQPGQVRGVLRHAPAPGEFHHARIAPCPALADRIQHFWRVTWDLRGGQPQRRDTLPHPNVHLVVEPGQALIHGIHSGRFTTTLQGRGGVFGVKFRAGAFHSCLRAPVSTLRNRSVPMADVFGPASQDFVGTLCALDDDAAMVASAEAFLGERLPAIDPEGVAMGHIADVIEADRTLTTVDAVCDRWNLGKRTLQRLFNTHVGIGPKWVINRYRMHEALAQLEGGDRPDWAALALGLGYFDQAHFIRDFKALVGKSPAQYASRSDRR